MRLASGAAIENPVGSWQESRQSGIWITPKRSMSFWVILGTPILVRGSTRKQLLIVSRYSLPPIIFRTLVERVSEVRMSWRRNFMFKRL